MWDVALAMVFAVAQAPAPAPAPSSVQALFDSAGAAAAKQDWAAALGGYEALQTRLGSKGNPRSIAIVRVRKGEALFRLSRHEEAEPELRAGLDALPPNDASLRDDRFVALLTLALIAEQSLRYEEARLRYAEAERAAPSDTSRLGALAGLVRTGMFDDPQTAVSQADRAIAIMQGQAGATKAVRAQWRTLKGRALLNGGDFAGARTELQLAVKELGGLSLRVDRSDIAARSDLAIAAMLAGNKDKAREYLAYTGAGLDGMGLGKGVDVRPPPCGGPEGLEPGDVAIVEFSIRDDGSVANVAPIYASKKGPAAFAFARAVRDWSWRPDQLKEIPPFFRALTRLEMRCSKSAEPPPVIEMLWPAVTAWMEQQGIADYEEPAGSYAAAAVPARTELARREARHGPQSPQLLPVIFALAGNPLLQPEALPLLTRADAIARANGGPPATLAWIGWSLAAARAGGRSFKRSRFAEMLRDATLDPAIQTDSVALAALRIAAADAFRVARRPDDALTLLRHTVADRRLEPRDALRVGALVRIAGIEAAAGDLGAARATFDQTGLRASECALVDAKPALREANTTGAFPRAAMQWGFEGWVITEFDITAEGRTANVRTVMAYPPFVFGDAAEDLLKGARYTQSYRPAGDLGCSGRQESVRFQIP